jgi:Protein of unknown function (DUF3489)
MSKSAKKRLSQSIQTEASAAKPSPRTIRNPDHRNKADPCSKQSRVIAMLHSPAGATIAAMMKATGWQQHSVRGFLAGVVRKRLNLKLGSKNMDGIRVYQIADVDGGRPGPRRSGHRSS